MYMTLTEEQAVQIRKRGLTVIEFKNCMRKGINVGWYLLNKFVRVVCEAYKKIVDKISDLVDTVNFFIEDIKDLSGFPTARRYKVVKFLSKLGYDKRKMWRATRHTFLARSNC